MCSHPQVIDTHSRPATGHHEGHAPRRRAYCEYGIDHNIVVRNATGALVTTVTISPKFQVVIPQEIREGLALEPGQKMQAFALEGRVVFVPVKPTKALRGFVRGISTNVPREGDRV